MKKIILQILTALMLIGTLSYAYLYLEKYYKSIDNRLRDYMFIYRGPIPTSGDVVIVDIDERSIKELGQYPWPRDLFAQVLVNLAEMGVGIVGLDIVYAEPDKSSPHLVLEKLGMDNEGVPNNDEILAYAMANTPTIAGYVFELENPDITSELAPEIPAIFVERNKPDNSYLIKPFGPILNIPIIQDNVYSSGFFNMIPDETGVVRSVPLVMEYEGFLYPSLSFEMIRAAMGINKVTVDYDAHGARNIELGDFSIPTDRYGRLAVNFRGGKMTFPYVSAVDIYNKTLDPKKVEGKFALVGTSAAGLLDLRSIPFESAYPGVEVHANVIDNIIAGDFLSQPSWADGANLVLIAVLIITASSIINFAGAITSLTFMLTALVGIVVGEYYLMFQEGIILSLIFPLVAVLSAFIFSVIINYFFETKQKELIKAKFSKKVSPAVVEDLMKNSDDTIMEGSEREVTVFFSDIRGFTNISEAMGSAKALIDLLNEYMDPMVDIIVEQEGTVDKFIGDAIMAYWNAPNNVPDHQDRAITTAISQLRKLDELNIRLKEENKPRIDIGIGLNTGLSVVGEMGSSGRSDYTVIGDPVNLASRLEGLCKPYGVRTIISEFTYQGLPKPDKYQIRELDLVRVKGKEKPVRIYEVIGFAEENRITEEEITRYYEGLYAYRMSEFEKALVIFREIKEANNHKLYQLYLERCEHYLESPPENFDGVFTFTTK